MPNGRRLHFYDCPGQPSYQTERTKIKSLILKGKFHAIINVVCYGYNETSAMSVPIFDENGNVRPQFLKENRRIELEQLSEWIGDINADSKIKWILTLINKEDIWKENQGEVIDYYEGEDYKSHFNGLSRVCALHVSPYCSVISPFGGRPMVLHISEMDKIQHHFRLIENLQEFTKKH